MKRADAAPYAFILLQSALYGFGDPISKLAYEEMPVYTLLAVRYTAALLFLLPLTGRRVFGGAGRAPLRAWIAPCLCIALCYLLSNVALTMTAATSVAFLRSLSLVMTPLLAWAAYRSRFAFRHIPVTGAAIVGLYLLCARGGLSGFGAGEALTLLSALLMAGALVFGARSLRDMDPTGLTARQIAVSAAVAALCAALFEPEPASALSAASVETWLIIFYLAAFCTLAGFLLQNAALTKLPARTVAFLQCACPVMTALFSFLLLGETLSFEGILGACLILAGVVAEIALK